MEAVRWPPERAMNRALWNAGGSPTASVYAEPAAGPAALPAFMVPKHVRQQKETSHERDT
jgi:hypothetical protein